MVSRVVPRLWTSALFDQNFCYYIAPLYAYWELNEDGSFFLVCGDFCAALAPLGLCDGDAEMKMAYISRALGSAQWWDKSYPKETWCFHVDAKGHWRSRQCRYTCDEPRTTRPQSLCIACRARYQRQSSQKAGWGMRSYENFACLLANF